MSLNLDDTVQISSGQLARLIALTELFGQTYADVLLEPEGLVRPMLVVHLRLVTAAPTAPRDGHTLPTPLFVARLAALQLHVLRLRAICCLRMNNHDDADLQGLVSVFVNQDGQSHPRLARALLELTPDQVAKERAKMERYYRQQEGAVPQIAIENIRQAKQRELLERRYNDLAALDRRLTLVPDLTLMGVASVAI